MIQAALFCFPEHPLPQRTPIDVSAMSSPSAAPTSTPLPKRRRIPIQIVDSDSPVAPSNAVASSSKPAGDPLLTPISSRVLPSALSSQASSTPAQTTTPAPSSASPPRQPPQTFRDAKTAKETRYRGGIFKADGSSKLFKSNSQTEPNGNASAPKRDPPQTLVAFMSLWNSLTTEEERWDVLRVCASQWLFMSALTQSAISKYLQHACLCCSRLLSMRLFWLRSCTACVRP